MLKETGIRQIATQESLKITLDDAIKVITIIILIISVF